MADPGHRAMLRELGVIRIATPCSEKWSRMEGTQTCRFCSRCGLNVYNLSQMSSVDARSLLMQTEGRLCVRFWTRRDGTLLTRDCPRGIQRLRRIRTVGSAFAAIALGFFLIFRMFADNVRALFGATMGALPGDGMVFAPRTFDLDHPPPEDAPLWLKERAKLSRAERRSPQR